jgi:predicted RNase H-like HicB family nuclease
MLRSLLWVRMTNLELLQYISGELRAICSFKVSQWLVRGRSLCYSVSRSENMKNLKIIVEKHSDGYVAYPLGIEGVIVGEGESYEGALADVKSAIRFHKKSFGKKALDSERPVLEVFVAEAAV